MYIPITICRCLSIFPSFSLIRCVFVFVRFVFFAYFSVSLLYLSIFCQLPGQPTFCNYLLPPLLSSCLSILLRARVCSVMGTAMWQQHSVNCCVLRTVLVSNPCTIYVKRNVLVTMACKWSINKRRCARWFYLTTAACATECFLPSHTIIRSPICFLLSGFSAFVIVKNNLNDTYVWCALTKQKQTHSLRFSPAN